MLKGIIIKDASFLIVTQEKSATAGAKMELRTTPIKLVLFSGI